MGTLFLHDFHESSGARFREENGQEVVEDYGDPLAEDAALHQSVGVLDLSFRGRLCLTGRDRQSFLHGQVTNRVKELNPGEGAYAALVSAKGRIESDLNYYVLRDEILVDFEPGRDDLVRRRLEKYIIAEDVQVTPIGELYGMLSIQGPRSAECLAAWNDSSQAPSAPWRFTVLNETEWGEAYCMCGRRTGSPGFDLFLPRSVCWRALESLAARARALGGRLCGWQAAEIARVEAGCPRFGIDMDDSCLVTETGLETQAISFSKGCYIGQEVISRIRNFGRVSRALRGVRLADDLPRLPSRGDVLLAEGKRAGEVTSAVYSPSAQANLALAYVRREHYEPGTVLTLRLGDGTESTARIAGLPFSRLTSNE